MNAVCWFVLPFCVSWARCCCRACSVGSHGQEPKTNGHADLQHCRGLLCMCCNYRCVFLLVWCFLTFASSMFTALLGNAEYTCRETIWRPHREAPNTYVGESLGDFVGKRRVARSTFSRHVRPTFPRHVHSALCGPMRFVMPESGNV